MTGDSITFHDARLAVAKAARLALDETAAEGLESAGLYMVCYTDPMVEPLDDCAWFVFKTTGKPERLPVDNGQRMTPVTDRFEVQ